MTSEAAAGGGWRWEVALSFAGAQRAYVEQVAAALKERGVRCFYDADEQIDLWGKYLVEELPEIYAEQAATVVVFASADYVTRDWTRLERRSALNRAVQERREYVLPARFDDTPLPGLLSGMVAVDLRDRAPGDFAEMIAAKLARIGLHNGAGLPGNAGPVGKESPAGGIRVSEAAPRRLGVRPAITLAGQFDDSLPLYVLRDTDTAGDGVRTRLTAASVCSGFVLLVGGSSVGKTRTAYEAVAALLPDWWLVHPAAAQDVAALALQPPTQTVVWLDELQRYLEGEHGLTGGTVRALLNGTGSLVIIATMWPDWYNAYTVQPKPGPSDRHTRERDVLSLADVITLSPDFSRAERDRAGAAARRDQRIRTPGYGLTQTLAGAPQLVAHWENAKTAEPYAWAVLTAALDAVRLGASAPLSPDLRRASAVGYCTSRQRADAPANWFDGSLAYATQPLRGAVAALEPAAAGMGEMAGYTVADYLRQHATRARRQERVPASTWDALAEHHMHNIEDVLRLADSANSRNQLGYASRLYQAAADRGDGKAASQLAYLLEERGDVDGAVGVLQAPARAGDDEAAFHLTNVLQKQGDVDGVIAVLRLRLAAGDREAGDQLADLLEERGDLDGVEQVLRACGGPQAASRLAELLEQRSDIEGLRGLADAGNGFASARLAKLLADEGDIGGLRAQAAAGSVPAAYRLAEVLEARGDPADAVDVLRVFADKGYWDAADRLASLLERMGRLDTAVELMRAWVDTPISNALDRLAELLVRRGDFNEATDLLRVRADADWPDGHFASCKLAEILAENGNVDELRAR
ncbi:MAG: TIR domain-containing protein [Mycobacteriales bacterium]